MFQISILFQFSREVFSSVTIMSPTFISLWAITYLLSPSL